MPVFNPIRLIQPENMGELNEQYLETNAGEFFGHKIGGRTYRTKLLEFANVEYWMKIVFYNGTTLNPGYAKVVLFTENVKYFCMFDGAYVRYQPIYAPGSLQGSITATVGGLPVSYPVPGNLKPVSYDIIYNINILQEPFNEQIFPITTHDDAEYDLMMLSMK